MTKTLLISIVAIMCIAIYWIFFSQKQFNATKQTVLNCETCRIKTEETAVTLAEDTLFKVYGESKIKKERPYNIKLVNNKVWLITGSLNQGVLYKLLNVLQLGGTFEIKINSKDGKVINLTHYK